MGGPIYNHQLTDVGSYSQIGSTVNTKCNCVQFEVLDIFLGFSEEQYPLKRGVIWYDQYLPIHLLYVCVKNKSKVSTEESK